MIVSTAYDSSDLIEEPTLGWEEISALATVVVLIKPIESRRAPSTSVESVTSVEPTEPIEPIEPIEHIESTESIPEYSHQCSSHRTTIRLELVRITERNGTPVRTSAWTLTSLLDENGQP